MEIKLYCVKSFTGSALKSKLELMLVEHNLSCQIKEENNAGEFIKDGISSIPAIKVMDKVITHDETSNIDDTVKIVLDVLQGRCERYILVPVDFTPESVHALRYAMMIASRLHKGITLVHIHEPLMDQVTNSAFDVEMMKRNRQRLDEILLEVGWDKFKCGNHIPMDVKFETGDAVSHIVPLMTDEKYDLIIMSTKAENTFWKRILSSVSIEVSRRSLKPVIIVPPDAEIKFPKKMLVGLIDELLYGLDFLLDFASDNEVFLEFVHFTNNNEHFERLKKNLTEIILSYDKKLKGFNVFSAQLEFNTVDESLLKKTSQNGDDMLVLMTHHRNLINSIGHRSISKRVLLQPHLPVMVLHGEDETGVGIIDYLYGLIYEG